MGHHQFINEVLVEPTSTFEKATKLRKVGVSLNTALHALCMLFANAVNRMMKPLLQRRTFWKGFATGMLTTVAGILLLTWATAVIAPTELKGTWQPTWELSRKYAQIQPIDLGPCDTRGKDCVMFDEDPVRTVPEPSTIWLLGLAGAVAVRNTLFGALTIAVVLLGHVLGLNEKDE